MKLRSTFSSPNNIRVINPRTMRKARHVVRMGEMRNAYKVLVGKPEGKVCLWHLGVNGRIILTIIFKNYSVKVWIRLN
jgi:hypothetical protein